MVAQVLWLEPLGGIAGDMFLAAALDAGLPLADLERALGSLGLPGWRLAVTRAEAGGIAGTHLEVVVEGPQPHHRALSAILALVRGSGLSPRAKEAALALFGSIGAAEARVHGIPVEQVHFHEVGAVDSVVDVCGAARASSGPRTGSSPYRRRRCWSSCAGCRCARAASWVRW
jgi:pyridinium-3,5-bisthiocarboxylic acid mononucleotide nickel chelatase